MSRWLHAGVAESLIAFVARVQRVGIFAVRRAGGLRAADGVGTGARVRRWARICAITAA